MPVCDYLPVSTQISVKLIVKRKHFNRCSCTLGGIHNGDRIVFTLLKIISFHLFMWWTPIACCHCTWLQHRRFTGSKLIFCLLFCYASLVSFTLILSILTSLFCTFIVTFIIINMVIIFFFIHLFNTYENACIVDRALSL